MEVRVRWVLQSQRQQRRLPCHRLSDSGPASEVKPTRDELCPLPIGEMRKALGAKGTKARAAWRFEHLTGRWTFCRSNDLRPGHVVILRSDDGGYDPLAGWDATSKAPVPPLLDQESPPIAQTEEATDADDLSFAPRAWVRLCEVCPSYPRYLSKSRTCSGLTCVSSRTVQAGPARGLTTMTSSG